MSSHFSFLYQFSNYILIISDISDGICFYLRSKQTVERKKAEAKQKKQEAQDRRRQAESAKAAARRKQREEELYDKKAEEATRHAEQLRRDRERCKDRIAGDHNNNNNILTIRH